MPVSISPACAASAKTGRATFSACNKLLPFQACKAFPSAGPLAAATGAQLAHRCPPAAQTVERPTQRGRVCSATASVMAYQVMADDQPFFRPAEPEDLDVVSALEAAGYPEDEAATPAGIRSRQADAGGLFMVAVKGEGVAGFVNGTLAKSRELTHESMSSHDPEGTTLCIHSVCVAEPERRKGLGLRMLKAYVGFVQQTTPELVSIRLICKEHLVGFYEAGGFGKVGPSPVVHGKDPWIEMAMDLEG